MELPESCTNILISKRHFFKRYVNHQLLELAWNFTHIKFHWNLSRANELIGSSRHLKVLMYIDRVHQQSRFQMISAGAIAFGLQSQYKRVCKTIAYCLNMTKNSLLSIWSIELRLIMLFCNLLAKLLQFLNCKFSQYCIVCWMVLYHLRYRDIRIVDGSYWKGYWWFSARLGYSIANAVELL